MHRIFSGNGQLPMPSIRKSASEQAHPGARASRPHSSPHSLPHLLHPARSANTPRICFAQAYAVPAARVTGCHIVDLLSGSPRRCMRARRPRSRGASFRDGVAAKDLHRYSCLFVFIRGSSSKQIGSFTLKCPLQFGEGQSRHLGTERQAQVTRMHDVPRHGGARQVALKSPDGVGHGGARRR